MAVGYSASNQHNQTVLVSALQRKLPLVFSAKVPLLRQLAVFLDNSPSKILVALEEVEDYLASQLSLKLHQVACLERLNNLRLLALASSSSLDSKTSLRVQDSESKRNPDFLVNQPSVSSQLKHSPDSQHNWEVVLLRDSAVKVLLAISQVVGSPASRTKDSSHKTLKPSKLKAIK